MSMLLEYFKEREGAESIETDEGFATYIISDSECYLKDIFVRPEFRKAGTATRIANEVVRIARLKGCTFLTGSVCPKAKNSTASLQVLIGYGMELFSSQDNLIIFKKDI